MKEVLILTVYTAFWIAFAYHAGAGSKEAEILDKNIQVQQVEVKLQKATFKCEVLQ